MAQDSRLGLLEEFLDQLAQQRRLSAGTARNYRRAVEELFVLNDGVSLKRLEAQHMRRTVSQLHSRGISGRTIAYMLSGWRGFFNWLVKHRGFPGNPCAGLRAPKSPKALPRRSPPTSWRGCWRPPRRDQRDCATRPCSNCSTPRDCGSPSW